MSGAFSSIYRLGTEKGRPLAGELLSPELTHRPPTLLQTLAFPSSATGAPISPSQKPGVHPHLYSFCLSRERGRMLGKSG